MKTSRPMTKLPLKSARMALPVARESSPAYSSRPSRKDFTRHRHVARMAPREPHRADYRGPDRIPEGRAELRDVSGLRVAPDRSAIRKAAERLLEQGDRCPPAGDCAPRPGAPPDPVKPPAPRPGTRPGASAATSPGGAGGGGGPGRS